MDKQAKKAGRGKAPATTTQIINLDTQKPSDWRKRDEDVGDRYVNEDGAKVYYEAGSYSSCIVISDIAVIDNPKEWELCLKYEDKDVRIIGSDKKIFCESIPEHTNPTLKSVVKMFSHAPEEAE
ncbi:MAG: hypothetical protein LBC64_08120 [Fibromonadaceae bacterium]|jgi:hypothetical protein|nr:hypothetical protein [Fibromonadaceae bacterium]